MIRIRFALLSCILLSNSLFSNTDTVVVEYDFSKQEFVRELPFDRLLLFKFENVPFTEFTFSCNEVKYTKLENSNYTADTIPVFREIVRGIVIGKDTTYTCAPSVRLKPNRDYQFKIGIKGKRSLTREEKEKIQELVEEKVDNLWNVLSTISFQDTMASDFNTNISLFIDNVENESSKELEKRCSLNSKVVSEWQKHLAKVAAQNKDIKRDFTKLKNSRQSIKDSSDSVFVERIISNWPDYSNSYEDLVAKWDTIESILEKYSIAFDQPGGPHIASLINRIPKLIVELNWLINNLIPSVSQDVVIESMQVVDMLGYSYPTSVADQAKLQMHIDIGGGYIWGADQFSTIYLLSFYFRPYKRTTPWRAIAPGERFWTLVSLDVGFTGRTFNTNEIRGVSFTNDNTNPRALLLGVGCRLASFVKFNGGMAVYQAQDPNPLISEYSTRVRPYVGLTIDINAKGAFTQLSNALNSTNSD